MVDISSTLPRRQLGRYLRELRQGSGLTIAELARRIERGATTVQRLETGTADRIRLWDVDAICQVCGAVGVRDSKNPTGPALAFAPADWDAFTAAVKHGGLIAPTA